MLLNNHNLPKPNFNPIILLSCLGLALIIGWFGASYFGNLLTTPAINNNAVSQAAVNKQTKGLLKQAALHLSKLNGGLSVGGFPKFEPPDGDESYQHKINEGSYTGQEANHWLKEINNFLRQIIKKNPNMTLEQILQKAGFSASQITNFENNLRDALAIAQSFEHKGVSPVTLETLESLMIQLGVSPWLY